ncbi:hypothetical protein [Methanoregula sp.]|uniref:hypothetical protein n=1 Tax=Methanoregula sp. TaxID=2052170 RepID=UPI003BB10EBF
MTCCDIHPEHTHQKTCRVCRSEYCHECHPSRLGICEKCGYKVLIGIVVIMVIVSYIAWFGVVF